MHDRKLVFFHNPHSRSAMTRALLEELGADFEIRVVDFRQGQQRAPDYLAINPLGKVPAIRHAETVVTETVAIYIYLADLYPEAGLAPALDDPQRGAYLRWLVFYAACFEPALGDLALKREPAPHMQSPYGSFAEVWQTLTAAIARGPWLLGERFSAADVLWGNALRWVAGFGMVEIPPVVKTYIERVGERPAQVRTGEADQTLAKDMGIAG